MLALVIIALIVLVLITRYKILVLVIVDSESWVLGLSLVQALYYGLRNASQGLWSSDDDKDAAFASLVAGLDGIVGGLSEDCLGY